jgi:hypothetical protein
VRHGAAALRDEGDVARVELHAVDEERPRDVHAQLHEQVNRRVRPPHDVDPPAAQELGERARRLAEELDLLPALRQVDRDREPLAERVGAGVDEQVLVHRVDRVRRDADPDELRGVGAEPLDRGGELRERGDALLRRRPEHLLVDDAARPELAQRAHRCARGGGVGERRHPRREPLGHAEPRGVEQHLGGEHRRARAGERAHPVEEGELLEEAAHRRELEVRVRVHEPGEQQRVAELHVVAGRGRVSRAHVPDRPTVHRHRPVLDGRRRDRQHPPGVVADHA